MRLGIKNLPGELWTKPSIATVRAALADSRLRTDIMVEALADDALLMLEDIERLSERIKHVEVLMRPFVRKLAPELLAMHGISVVVAAGLIGHGGNVNNCRDASAFAMRAGTAPRKLLQRKARRRAREPWGKSRTESTALHHRIRADANRRPRRSPTLRSQTPRRQIAPRRFAVSQTSTFRDRLLPAKARRGTLCRSGQLPEGRLRDGEHVA